MADILGNIVSGIFGIGGQAHQFQHQSALQQQQNEFNLQMWKLNNEYNSPQAQMERFKAAGLNPNLIYGQGSNGNSSSPPIMGTPEAPNYSKSMEKIAQAFNIEGLRTQIADRKKSEAEAKIAKINADRERDHYKADQTFGQDYDFDMNTGQFVPHVQTPDAVTVYAYPASRYYKLMHLSDNYRTNSLLLNRSNLLRAQYDSLQPQIWMNNYEKQHYPTSYWIGQGTRVIHGAADAVGIFHPKNWFVPRSSFNPYSERPFY